MSMTTIVYTKEEALAMEPHRRPMCYRVPGSIYHEAFVAVGAGSMCWHETPKGVFNPEEAEKHVLNLLFLIAKELETAGVTYENWPSSWKGEIAE